MTRAEEAFALATRNTGACIVWPHTRSKTGYGYVQAHGRPYRVHRLVWEHFNHQLNDPKVQVCHHCDNPPCINPQHLFIGSILDNTRDKCRKGRHHNFKKTHCPSRHEYTPENTYIRFRDGQPLRFCKQCSIDSRKRSK